MDPVTPARVASRASFPIRRRRPKKNVLCNVDQSVPGKLARRSLAPERTNADQSVHVQLTRRSLAPESTKPLHPPPSPSQPQPASKATTRLQSLPIPETAPSPRLSPALAAATTASATATPSSAKPVAVEEVNSGLPSNQTSPAPFLSPAETEERAVGAGSTQVSGRAQGPPKRKKLSSKAYASVPADVSQEERFRILIETFLQARHAAAVQARPQPDKDAMDAMETAVLDGIEAAGEPERSADSEKISALTRPNPEESDLRQRAEKLDYIVAQYADELQQWESLEKDLPVLAAKTSNDDDSQPDLLGNSPLLPTIGSLLGAGESEARPPLVDAVESFILHNDDVNCSLKRLEAQHEHASVVISAVTKTINASVFEGGLPGLSA